MHTAGDPVNGPPGGPYPARRARIVAFLLYQAIFWIGILVPFDFYQPASLWGAWLAQNERPEGGLIHILSGFGHAFFFLPLGGLLASQIASGARRRAWLIASFIGVTALGSEFAQLFNSRGPSLSDFAMDLGGAVAGWWLFGVHERSPRLRRWVRAGLAPRFLAAVFTVMLLAYGVLVTPPAADFGNWDPDFHFLVGNEGTHDRPWDGSVAEVLLLNRALDDAEVARVFETPALEDVEAPLLHYRFDVPAEPGSSPVRFAELSRRLPRADLLVVGGGVPALHDGALRVDTATFATTPGPIPELRTVLQSSVALTLIVRFKAESDTTDGPGRIVSYSGSSLLRNFTLAQGESALHFRVRTTFTGLNGVYPEVIAASSIRPGQVQWVVAVTDGREGRLYVDGDLSARAPFSYLSWLEVAFFDQILQPHIRFTLLVAAWLVMMLFFGAMLLPFLGGSAWLEVVTFLLASAVAAAVYAFSVWVV